jgi:hypothetical protein
MANREAIAWYVEEAQRLLEEQQRRAESLRTRGGQIAGFGALFLVLIGGNASRILHESHGSVRVAIAVMLINAALCLALSIATAVAGVSKHRTYVSLAAAEIAIYLTEPFLDAPELWRVHVRTLRSLERTIKIGQREANSAVKLITVSLYAFLVGLALAVLSVGTLIVELI